MLRPTYVMLWGLLCASATAQLQPAVVNENRSARSRIQAAIQQVEAGNATDGFAALEQIVAKDGNQLARARPNQFLTVRDLCHAEIGRLSDNQLAAYRERIDTRANQWLARGEAGETRQFERILDEAPHSAAGPKAAFQLGQLAWESGDAGLAYDYWRRLLPASNNVGDAREGIDLRLRASGYADSMIAARLVFCRVAMGDLVTARGELRAFRKQFPTATGTIGTQSGLLKEILARAIAFAADGARSNAGGHWHKVWTRQIPVRQPDQSAASSVLRSAGLAVQAATSKRAIFLCDGDSVFGMGRENGLNLWTRDADARILGRSASESLNLSPNSFRCQPVVADGRLLVRLGSLATSRGTRMIGADQTSSLVCLGLRWNQGKTLWRVESEDIVPGSVFESAPVVFGSRCFAVLRTSPPKDTLHLVCLAFEDGKVEWRHALCSGIDQPPEAGQRGSSLRPVVSSAHVVVSTDNGLVVALRHDGHFEWARTYERVQTASRYAGERIVVRDGVVFVAPEDSQSVLAIRERTGDLAWQVELPDRVESIADIHAGKVIVAGRGLWGLLLRDGSVEWGGPRKSPEHLGNGVPTRIGNDILFPTRRAIEVRDVHSGDSRVRSIQLQGGNMTAFSRGAVVVRGSAVTLLQRDE